jgi:guanylate kinase
MSHAGEFDYVIINDHFETAVRDLQRILDDDARDLQSDRAALATLMTQLLA